MANSSAHRLPDHLNLNLNLNHNHRHHHNHNHNHHQHQHHRHPHPGDPAASLPSVQTGNGGGSGSGPSTTGGGGPDGGGGSGGSSATSSRHFKGHQRRQSVARLLPDISKLRLLSWLVEASSELINCDIAIMDGVYAKLNRSRESLLFWDSNNGGQLQSSPTRPPPPPPPSVQPVANSSGISQQQRKFSHNQQVLLIRGQQRNGSVASRNHHSLPITNYDASSLAAVSMSPSLGAPPPPPPPRPLPRKSATAGRLSSSRKMTGDSESLMSSFRMPGPNGKVDPMAAATSSSQQQQQTDSSNSKQPMGSDAYLQNNRQQQQQQQQQQAQNLCDNDDNNNNNNNNDDSCDSNQSDDDDDDNSSAASSSSGIHGGGTSLSSAGSTSSAASTASGDVATSGGGGSAINHHHHQRPSSVSTHSGGGARQAAEMMNNINSYGGGGSGGGQPIMSSAELLSEKIRRTVMKHNYLQSLLVNIIRQHDRLRDQMNQQRRRQMSIDQYNLNRIQQQQQQRIDLAELADAIDDGCFCLCHSTRHQRMEEISICNNSNNHSAGTKSSTLPATHQTKTSSSSNQHDSSGSSSLIVAGSNPPGPIPTAQPPAPSARKLRRKKGTGRGELNREDMINLLADRLCENCFETHYWLHGECSPELSPLTRVNKAQGGETNNTIYTYNTINTTNTNSGQDFNSIIAQRNATFIKLVQQEVRSTISKSIELIDLIRKEIKLPESIKQKQLMRCFSTSIQLLTSVGNYVVPAQDISSFIPEGLGQQESTTLFSLPSSDFDHLLLYPPSNHHHHHHQQQHSNNNNQIVPRSSNYHLAQAPEIPIRRRYSARKGGSCSASLTCSSSDPRVLASTSGQKKNGDNEAADSRVAVEQALSSNLQKLKTCDTKCATLDSTSTPNTTNTSGGGGGGTNGQPAVGQVQDSSSGASSNNSSASSSIARGTVQQSSLTRAHTSSAILDGKTSHGLSFEAIANLSRQQTEDDILYQSRPKFWQSSKFNFIKKLLHVKQQRLLRQQSKDRRIYNNKVQSKFRLVMMDLTHFNKSQQLLTTENGVNSLLTSMRNVLEFGLYLTLKLY